MANKTCVFEEHFVTAEKITCVCCFSKDVKVTRLLSCRHTGVFELLTGIKMEYDEMYVCYICHHMLEKFATFKKQVEDNLYALQNKASTNRHKKRLSKHNLAVYELNTKETNNPETIQCVPIEYRVSLANIIPVVVQSQLPNDTKGSTSKLNQKEMAVSVKLEVKNEGDIDEDGMDNDNTDVAQDETQQEQVISTGIRYIKLTEDEVEKERQIKLQDKRYILAEMKCETCIVTFDHEQYMKEHTGQRHDLNIGDFVCKICKSVYKNLRCLTEHIKRHYIRYECLDCGKRYGQHYLARAHYNTLHSIDKEMYQCGHCDFETDSYRVYRHHRNEHNRVKYTCKQCNINYKTSSSLKKHYLIMHSAKPTEHECGECSKKFKFRNSLVSHMKALHGPSSGERHYCAECDKYFKSKYIHQAHMKTRAHYKPEFECHDCSKHFPDKKNLEKHITFVHLKKSNFVCSKCNKLCKTASSMRQHIRTVHEKVELPRNRICDYCGKGFTSITILRTHIRTHTGERPLQCQHCPATFAHPGARYTHNKLVHGMIPKKDQIKILN